MQYRHGTADEMSDGGAILVAWNAGGVETLVIRGGKRAAISQMKNDVFPLEIIVVEYQTTGEGEPFEEWTFIPGKNLRSDVERRMAESAWLRNSLESSLRPKTVRKVSQTPTNPMYLDRVVPLTWLYRYTHLQTSKNGTF